MRLPLWLLALFFIGVSAVDIYDRFIGVRPFLCGEYEMVCFDDEIIFGVVSLLFIFAFCAGPAQFMSLALYSPEAPVNRWIYAAVGVLLGASLWALYYFVSNRAWEDAENLGAISAILAGVFIVMRKPGPKRRSDITLSDGE